jgi:hypothetical protein
MRSLKSGRRGVSIAENWKAAANLKQASSRLSKELLVEFNAAFIGSTSEGGRSSFHPRNCNFGVIIESRKSG